jgi:crotonobetainyl-CoA:carnitine CoA-transferase CaiB-like acyl-CoA transferase
VDELNAAVAAWIETEPVDELCRKLDEGKLAYSFIYSVEDIMKDPHYKARGTITSVPDDKIGPVRMAGVIPKFSHTPEKPIASAPDLGQHNDEIYGRLLGLTPERIAELGKVGVL